MKLNIRQKVLLLVLSCSLISLLLLGGVVLYGVLGMRSSAEMSADEIRQVAADSGEQTIESLSEEYLVFLASERGDKIEAQMQMIQNMVHILSSTMTDIMSHPEEYGQRSVQEPRREDAGQLSIQLLYGNGVDGYSPELRQEIGLTANVQDVLRHIKELSPVLASDYVSSRKGYTIIADSSPEKKMIGNRAMPFEARQRPWYQLAMKEKRVVITDVVEDAYGGGPCIICAAPYYQGEEAAGVVGADILLRDIRQIVLDTKVGASGFGLVVNHRGQVIFSPKQEGVLSVHAQDGADLRTTAPPELAEAVRQMVAGEEGLMRLSMDGTDCYLAYAPLDRLGWSFAIVVEASELEADSSRLQQKVLQETEELTEDLSGYLNGIGLGMAVAFLLIVALAAFSGYRLAGRFVRPIDELSAGVKEIASGNLNKKIQIHTGDEIEHLAASFNKMTDDLSRYIHNLTLVTAEKERIATELNVAAGIQESMLPNHFPAFPERKDFDIYATMQPAKEVGGDFYDFYLFDADHLVVTMADVSGKGVPASLFMVVSKTVLKNLVMTMARTDDLTEVVVHANERLCQNNDAMMFVTVLLGMLDLRTGEFLYVNAGHTRPLVYRKERQKCEYLEGKKNPALGIMEDAPFGQQKTQLRKGDILFLYTDGVNEAMDPQEELYGCERLQECLQACGPDLPLQKMLAKVRLDIQKYVEEAPPSDDITMLAVRLDESG